MKRIFNTVMHYFANNHATVIFFKKNNVPLKALICQFVKEHDKELWKNKW